MISIIVPIYKAEKYLSECLMSIQNQSYQNFEVICINDGSPDNSVNIVNEYAHSDSRFKLYSQENSGVSSARNLGLSYARGEYICFIDSDDIVDKLYLETLIHLAEDGSFAVCSYSRDLKHLGRKARQVCQYSIKEYITHIINESIEHPNICMMLFKNSIIQTQHLDFTVGCVRGEDTEFYMKYLLYENTVTSTDYKGYFYRINASSAMHVTTIKSLTGIEASKRIGCVLFNNGYTDNVNILLCPAIQSILYHVSREHNLEIYNLIHRDYDVKSIMKDLIHYQSKKRRIIAFAYLLVGQRQFYRVLSSKIANKLPL